MAGFKIAEAFVEVHARTDSVGPSVAAAVRRLPGDVGGDADRAGSGIGARIGLAMFQGAAAGSRGGSVFSSVLAVMASKMAIFSVAGLGAVGIVQQLMGVVGMLPALGFAGGAALGTLAVGMAGFSDSLGETDTPAKLKKVNEALASLSPQARETALTLRGLAPAWTEVRKAVQDNLFAGMAAQVKTMATAYLPLLKTGMSGTAQSINSMVQAWVGFATAPRTIADTNLMFANTKGFLDGIAAAVRPFVSALTDVAVVGSGFLPRFGEWLAKLAVQFSAFTAKARESGRMREWIQGGIDALQTLWTVVKNVWQAISDLGSLIGGPLLGTLMVLSTVLAAVTGFIRDWANILFPIAGGILGVVGAMKAWTLAVAGVKLAMLALNAVFAMNPFVLLAMVVVSAALLIITNWDKVKVFLTAAWTAIKATAAAVWGWITSALTGWVNTQRTTVTAVWSAIKATLLAVWNAIKATAAAVWAGITGAIRMAVDNARAVLAWFGGLGGMMRGWWNAAVNAVTAAISNMLEWVRGIPGRVMSSLGNLGGLLAGAGRSLVDGFLNGIKGAWSRVVSYVKSGVQEVRDLFPFSPAKEGPFSGRGYVSHSGRALASDFAESLRQGMPGVVSAARDVLGAAQIGLSGPAMAGAPGVTRAGSRAASAPSPGRDVHVHITQTAGSPAETGRFVALALRSVG